MSENYRNHWRRVILEAVRWTGIMWDSLWEEGKNEVHRIYVAVDATDEVIEEAIEAQADMLVTHHPMIFSGMKQITEDDLSAEEYCA